MKQNWYKYLLVGLIAPIILSCQNTTKINKKEHYESYDKIITRYIRDATNNGKNREYSAMFNDLLIADALIETMPYRRKVLKKTITKQFNGQTIDSILYSYVKRLKIEVTDTIHTEKTIFLKLRLTSDDKPIKHLNYRYQIGDSLSKVTRANQGIGFIQIDKKGFQNALKTTQPLYLEVGCFNQMNLLIHQELLGPRYIGIKSLESFVEQTDSRYRFKVVIEPLSDRNSLSKIIDTINTYNEKDSSYCRINKPKHYYNTIETLFQSSKNINQPLLESSLFTPEGYLRTQKLMGDNVWVILKADPFETYQIEKDIISRGHFIAVTGKKNQYPGVEELVFHFNESGKIDDVTYGMSYSSLKAGTNTKQPKQRVLQFYRFLDDYYTSYYTRNFELLQSVFNPQHLVVGCNNKNDKSNSIDELAIVKYDKVMIMDWLNGIENCSKNPNNVLLEIHNVKIQKKHLQEIYGINFTQTLFSDCSPEKTIIFLLIGEDQNNDPKIFVTAIQHQPDKDGTTFSLSDFNSN